MEKLSAEQQADIRKMSTERLIARLLRAGVDEENIGEMDRAQLLDLWAELVSTGRDKPTVSEISPRPVITGFDTKKKKRMLEFMKFEESRKEREERRRREDEEREERRRKEEEEREERRHERELRLRELQLREDELARQTRRDTNEAAKRQSLAARTKFFSEAMKNVFWKFPNDPAEIPGYFEHIENLFSLYEVDDDVKSKLLQAHLNDRAKTLTVRLSRDQLDNYDALKDFLLNEFKISPIQLRERFFSL